MCHSYSVDCDRVCPWRGTLSEDCSVCHCANTIVYGMVKDNNNMPVGDVNVYIQSRQWKPLTTTNAFGQYSTEGVCLMGVDLVFKKDQFSESTCSARMRNFTHWICDTTLNQTGTNLRGKTDSFGTRWFRLSNAYFFIQRLPVMNRYFKLITRLIK